jgi:hypothetical protein
LRWKPSAPIAASTRVRVCAPTRRVRFRTCETVVAETPASRATSLSVTWPRSAGAPKAPIPLVVKP